MKKGFWAEPRSLVAIAVCLLALAEIIDLTIVAVAIPHIMGALGCNIQEVSLVTTSYIVASAVFIMMTGYVSKRFGSKKTILGSSLVFGLASIMCGLSSSLGTMVLFRLVQGVGGAFLPSMAQGYISENFNDEERPKMMSVLTLTMVLGPIIGPIMGGYLVQTFDWRWCFFVNVPICITSFVIVIINMKETETTKVNFEGLSFIFMAVGFGCLEYFIDEGNNDDWFNSHKLIIVLLIGLTSITFFIWRGLRGKAVVSFKLFLNSNFVLCCLYVFFFMVLATSSIAYYPTLLQTGYGFPVDFAGYITGPRGIFAVIGAIIISKLCLKYDKRYLLYLGILLMFCSTWLQSNFGATWSLSSQLLAGALLGMGMSATFAVILQVTFTGINKALSNDAAGVFNFFRNIGNSVGTSIASTIISRQQQVAWNDMSTQITPFHSAVQQLQNGALGNMILQKQALYLSQIVQAQSFLIANIDVFCLSCYGVLALAIIPPFLAKPPKGLIEVSAG